MTLTVALLILVLGVLIGHRLHRPLGALKTLYRRHRYKWQVLRPWTPDPRATPATPAAAARTPTSAQTRTDRPQPSRAAQPHA
jgi:hypothetical protein